MDVASLLLATALLLSGYFFFKILFQHGENVNHLPPGPYGVPFLGFLPFMGRNPHLTFTQLGKKYGSIFSVKMGNYTTIVLHDYKAIKGALVDQGDVFAGRPRLEFSKKVSNNVKGIITTDGNVWKVHRRFALSRLRDFGFGKRSLETVIDSEVDELCSQIARNGEAGVDMKSELFTNLLNVVWGLVGGKRFDRKDPSMDHIKKVVTDLITLSGLHFYSFMPTFLIKFGFGSKIQQRLTVYLEMKNILQKEIDFHRETISNENPRDLIDMYLIEMEKQRKESKDKSKAVFSEENMIATTENLFLAGVETTTNTLTWGIHFMVIWTEAQEKIQQELDNVVGNGRAPSLEDRSKLPYTMAAIMEVQRYASIVPLSIVHRCTMDTTLMGYHIPKDAVVVPNLWNVSRDPALWEDPDNFRPERFLNDEGKVEKPDYFLPFSLGPRICLGMTLANVELFLFFSNLLHRFRFERPPGAPPPNLRANFGLTLSPPTYTIIAKKRF